MNRIWIGTFPRNVWVSGLLTAVVIVLVGVGSVILGTLVFRQYGDLLFVGLPFVLGFLTVLLHGNGGPRGFLGMAGVIGAAMLFVCMAMMVCGIEGMGCMIMVLPLWSCSALLGVCAAYPIHRAIWRHATGPRGFPVMIAMLLLALPTLMGAEAVANPEPPMIAVVTSVEIDAPPEVVWGHVIEFPEMEKPHDWVFVLGAAYPKHAVIVGHGVGAERRCVFSTGAFVEPITKWEENKLLAFDVVKSPPSMQEWSIYENLHPPHVEGYLMSRHGQFKLTALPGGRTRLEGTTWYQNYMFPVAYWELWSDAVIHRIHLRVLGHIKVQAERVQLK